MPICKNKPTASIASGGPALREGTSNAETNPTTIASVRIEALKQTHRITRELSRKRENKATA